VKKNKKGCPICAGRLVVKGVNDISTTASFMLPYFKNIEDAYAHTRTSKDKVIFKCPDCGTERLIEIGKVYARGFSCQVCSDSISFPNKFARGLLKQLPINNWICEYHIDNKFFDNYFEYNNKKYILEMDGEQHKSYIGRGRSLKEEQKNDKLKDELAKSNNIEMIRIDCYYSDRYYIQKNIESSLLNKLFDLSKIDWNYCTEIACKNLVFEVADYYNKISIDTKEIADFFKLNRNTVVEYLKQANSFGKCDFTYELVRKRVGEKNKRTLRDRFAIPVKVFNPSMEYIGSFPNLMDCCDMLSEKYKIDFKGKSVLAMLHRHNNKTKYKGWYFEIIGD